MSITLPVLFRELPASNGKCIGLASLNAPRTLNALSLDMVDLLHAQFISWSRNPRVAMVMLDSTSERAFCAGGDLQGLYREMRSSAGEAEGENQGVRTFFEREYRLDHAIHTYPKPLLCWGNGLVMGGGMGLMIGASHRVLTETSTVSMPEIAIGLFPDVGMSWMLNRMPGKSGLFMGLTGSQIGARDALYAGWADYQLPQAEKAYVLGQLSSQDWSGNRAMDDVLLHRVLRRVQSPSEAAPGPLQSNQGLISELCSVPQLDEIVEAITQIQSEDRWLMTAAANLRHGAPSTARLVYELHRRTRHRSLAEVFKLETEVAVWCSTRGDFEEGIRALLIDKDKTPVWKAESIQELDDAWGERLFGLLEG